jgi:hypothetical protein
MGVGLRKFWILDFGFWILDFGLKVPPSPRLPVSHLPSPTSHLSPKKVDNMTENWERSRVAL